MALMLACGALVVIGLVLIVAWGNEPFRPPPGDDVAPEGRLPTGLLIRRYLWWLALALGCGAGAGLLMAGAGGRLAMRLLAVTAPESAQGRITEADEVVGLISTDGTIGFIIFIGILFGVLIGIFYTLIQRWLPRGRLGGLTFGVLLLVWFGTVFDPLRPDNPDFEIVGPGWVSVLTFSALVILHGMLVAAIAGRYSRSLPLISKRWRTIVPYAPLLLLVPGFILLAAVTVGALIALAFNAAPRIRQMWESRQVSIAGRAIGLVAAAIMTPVFVIGMVGILERSPN
ncbi:MAG: hypothetical protein ACRDKT_17985 [Actinomycetota bacterium]